MNVLIACATSGVLRRAFRDLGHNAWECDLLPGEDGQRWHIQGDAIETIRSTHGCLWDLVIAHPPCTYLSSSGLHWNGRVPGRTEKTDASVQFVKAIARTFHDGYTKALAIENPIGCLSTRFRKPDQIIQPHQFGDDASKATCLWLFGLPKLAIDPALQVPGRLVDGKRRWANQTDSGQNRLAPSATRWKERSRTYPGIAAAMAATWGAS